MKKYVGLLLLICSFTIFCVNKKERLNFEITEDNFIVVTVQFTNEKVVIQK